jgi:hypothetical protein
VPVYPSEAVEGERGILEQVEDVVCQETAQQRVTHTQGPRWLQESSIRFKISPSLF